MDSRLVFEKGKQKKFLEEAKNLGKYRWKDIAIICNVKEGTARNEWRNEKTTMPISAFNSVVKRLPAMSSHRRYIRELKHPFWGSKIAAANANDKQGVKITVPQRSESLAELIGIVLGDGSLYSNRDFGIYYLCIVGHSNEEDYLMRFIKPLLESLLGIKVKVRKSKYSNSISLKIQGRRIIDYFAAEHSLVPGDKIKNRLSIPAWIKTDDNFVKACIRGLIDTDGSVFRLSRKDPLTVRINFKNNNKTLLNDTHLCFKGLGYSVSKIIGNQFFITKKADTERYFKEIGFNNPKNTERFKEIAP